MIQCHFFLMNSEKKKKGDPFSHPLPNLSQAWENKEAPVVGDLIGTTKDTYTVALREFYVDPRNRVSLLNIFVRKE